MKALERKKQLYTVRLQELNDKLGKEMSDLDSKQLDELVADIKKAEEELYTVKLRAKVAAINKREGEKRNVLRDILKLGKIDHDLITNDCKLHGGRRNKHPELYEFVDKHDGYVYFSFDKYQDHRLNIHVGGVKYTNEHFDYKERVKTVMGPDDFEKACVENGILPVNKSAAQISRQIKKIEKLADGIKSKLAKYNEALKETDYYWLSNENFMYRDDIREYTYRKDTL